MKRKIQILLVVLALLCSNFMGVYAWDLPTLNETESNTENEELILSSIFSQSTNQVITQFNQLSADTEDINSLIPYAQALANKIEEIPTDVMMNVIGDGSNSIELRVTMIQLLQFKDIIDSVDESLRMLLQDNNIEYDIKHNIIWALSDSDFNKDLLVSIANGSDNALAFQAIKKLSKTDMDRAIPIIDNILTNYQDENIEKVRAAIKAKARQLKENNSSSGNGEARDFIRICLDVFKSFDDKVVKDTAVFALSDINDENAITALINNQNLIDTQQMAYCIRENQNTLLSMIKNNSDTSNVAIVIKAMKINPIKEILDSLDETINIQSIELLLNANSPITPMATGFQGYAVYRDLELTSLNWHGGVMNRPNASYYNSVIEATNGSYVRTASWATFRGSSSLSFHGVYRPAGGITSTQRDNVVQMANRLVSENITYTLPSPMAYPIGLIISGAPKVEPSDIVGLRCDGVIEYCYEYYGCKIYGGTATWNISLPIQNNLSAHSAMTPKGQASKMTLVQPGVPN